MKKLLLFIPALIFFDHVSFPQWTSISSFPNSYANDIIFSGDTIFTSTAGSGVYISVNGGSNWTQTNNGLNNSQALSVNQLFLNGNVIYAATVDGIYKSTNRGQSWVKKSSGIVIGGGALYEFTVSISQLSGKLFTGAYTGIYTSTDGAESWHVTNASGSAVMAKNFTLHNGIIFAARETNNTPYAYNSTNNGLTWNIYNTLNMPTITFFSEPPVMWAGTIDGVWLSTNDGVSWQMRNSGLSLDPYSSSIIRVNGTLVTSLKFGGSGVYRTSNNGLNWEEISQGLPFLSSIEKLVEYNGKVIAATSGGLYQRNISEIVVGVESHTEDIPSSYKLYQNYPNPFNPETIINYELPISNYVRLSVYDIIGKEISVLVNDKQQAGNHKIILNASNYPSGVYYYRLETSGYSETKKMILLK
jgi:ligand-binding sensor domain-containing protein